MPQDGFDFRSFFRSILGPFWEVLGRSKTAPGRSKTASRRPKMRARRPKMAPGCVQDGFKTAKEAILSQVDCREAQEHENVEKHKENECFLISRGEVLEGLLGSQGIPGRFPDGPGRSQEAPKTPQDVPRRPRRPQDGPIRSQGTFKTPLWEEFGRHEGGFRGRSGCVSGFLLGSIWGRCGPPCWVGLEMFLYWFGRAELASERSERR